MNFFIKDVDQATLDSVQNSAEMTFLMPLAGKLMTKTIHSH